MICRNASDNYVHAKCESKEEIDGTRKCLKCYQRIEETSESMESSFAGKVGLVHVICYPKKRKLITSNEV